MSLESYDCANGTLVSSQVADQSAVSANFALSKQLKSNVLPGLPDGKS